MKIYRTIEDIDIKPPTAVTVGTFDGVHLGHQHVLKKLEKCPEKLDCSKVLVTFHPHPKKVVAQKFGNKVHLLTTLEEKLDLLHQFGLDAVVVIPFTESFSQTRYQDFVKNILVDRLHVNYMVVGHDHAFGRNREGHIEQLKEISKVFGFDVEVLEPYYVAGEIVSSSTIRDALLEGELDKAAVLFGRPYFIRGEVIKGDDRGKKLGFPTANIKVNHPNKLIPKKGVYAVVATVEGIRYKGMMNIGHRPTFNFDALTLEVHLINFSGSIYGEEIQVELKKYIREEKKFKDANSLKKQLDEDRKICVSL